MLRVLRTPSALRRAALIGCAVTLLPGCGRLRYQYLFSDGDAGASGMSSMAGAGGTASVDGDAAVSMGGTASLADAAAGSSFDASFDGCVLDSIAGPVRYEIGEVAQPDGFVVLKAKHSGKCLQVQDCAFGNDGDLQGVNYEQGTCNYEACQVFDTELRDQGFTTFQNVLSGFCVDAGGQDANGTVVDFSCHPSTSPDLDRDNWLLTCEGQDSWRITNRGDGSALAVSGGSADGASVIYTQDSGGDEQLWQIEWRASVFDAVLPTSEADPGVTWRYTTSNAPNNWEQPSFNENGWSEGPGGFGDGLGVNSPARTDWNSADIWLRTNVSLAELPTALDLRINHDHAAEVYVNGVEIVAFPDWTSGYRQFPLDAAALSAFTVGDNLIAVHCHNDSMGEQFVDLGLGHYGWR